MIKKDATRFRHHFLDNGAVLTVATCLKHEPRTVTVGWAMMNPNDKKWVRKLGVYLARHRLETFPLYFNLSPNEPVVCDYISLRALWVILTARMTYSEDSRIPKNEHPVIIPEQSIKAIYDECFYVQQLLGQRMRIDEACHCSDMKW